MNTYKTHGTCSRAIEYEVQDGIVTECRFVGGCMGNTQGVAALVKGMKVEDAIALSHELARHLEQLKERIKNQ